MKFYKTFKNYLWFFRLFLIFCLSFGLSKQGMARLAAWSKHGIKSIQIWCAVTIVMSQVYRQAVTFAHCWWSEFKEKQPLIACIMWSIVSKMLRSQTRLLDLGRRQLRLPCLRRFFSSKTNSLTLVEVDDKTGIATVTMNRPPVNSFNLELLKDLHESIKQVEYNKSRGLVLTSVSLPIVR